MRIAVRVGYSVHRPIIPDECFTHVVVEAGGWNEASLLAAQVVAARIDRNVGMVTSTELAYPGVVPAFPGVARVLLRILKGGNMGKNGVPHPEGEQIIKPGVFPREHPDDESTLPPEPNGDDK